MSQLPAIQQITELVEKIIAESEDVFLVSVRIKPVNNFKIFVDADNGINIDRCVKINRAMYKVIEEEAWYPDGNFSLEVSSPGVDEPLLLPRQFKKNIGRTVAVTLSDDIKLEGKMTDATDEGILIEYKEGKNKKAVLINKVLAFEEIKQVIVQISF
jgi:ribosome maturation factor RimP